MESDEKTTQNPWVTWKAHPAAIIGGTIVATLLFAQSVLVPVTTADLRAQISDFTRKEQATPALEKRIVSLQTELDATKESFQNLKLEREREKKEYANNLAVAQLTRLFDVGTPYPIGLGQVRLGDRIEKVPETYSDNSIQKRSSYWSVKTSHTQFSNVTYYFRPEGKSFAVTHVLLQFNRDLPVVTLSEKLVEAFGSPAFQNDGCRYWKFSENLYAIQTVNPDLPKENQLQSYVIATYPFQCRQR